MPTDPDVKQVIVVRKDLNMRRGKENAQVGHAVMGPFLQQRTDTLIFTTEVQRIWFKTGTKKICVQVDSEQELRDIGAKASKAGLDVYHVIDSGLTEFEGPTLTCISIGPFYSDTIDTITGHLKLR